MVAPAAQPRRCAIVTDDLAYIRALARSAAALVAAQAGTVERLTKTHATTTAEAVTACDRAAQRHIVAALRARFPHDGIIGEESDDGAGITHDRGSSRRTWVIDPIDGTNNFVAGLGCWAVCIGLIEDGMPVLGVVHDVARDVSYAAARGRGAWANERQVRCAPGGLSDRSLIMLTCNLVRPDGSLPAWYLRWSQQVWKLRMLGSAALEAVQVGAGVAHGAITLHGKLWDLAAAAAIVLEAGGTLSDLAGKPVFPIDLAGYAGAKVPFLAAAPEAHAGLLAELADDNHSHEHG
jgi:myo-inositol-1(or 4)-monophosphatase